jgi:predicted nucleic acid-binding protein
LATDLGSEAEAIAIAHERNALLILDDALARRHAKLIGVTVTGTLGVLLEPKSEGHIHRTAPLVTRLTELGFRLVQTRDAVLKLANEG